MNDESTQIPEKLPPGELVAWMRHDNWTRDDAMLILMGIEPDRTAITERRTDYGRPEWVFGADGPSMMAGYDQTPPRAEIRRLEERLTAMMDTWNSGNHPRLCTPAYYIKWAVNHGFEVSWLEAAHRIGLIGDDALKLVPIAGQRVVGDGEAMTQAQQEPKQELGAAAPALALDIDQGVEEAAPQVNAPTQDRAPKITIHRIKNKKRELDAEIESARNKATDGTDYHAVWTALKEMALSSVAPFTGQIDGKKGLEYTNSKEKLVYFSKRALCKRMNPTAR